MAKLSQEMFRYLAELASMNVKQIRTADEWTVEGLDHAVTWLSKVPAHPAVQSALPGHPGTGDPSVLLTIRRPAVPEPPPPPHAWRAWADDEGVQFDPAIEDVPAPDGEPDPYDERRDRIEAARREAPVYQAAIEQWRPKFEVASKVLGLYSRLWKARRIVDTDPERFETIAGVGVLDWVPDGKLSRRPVLVAPARIDFDPEEQRVDIVIDPASVTVETDMLPPTSKPSDGAVERLRNQLDEIESIFELEGTAEALTGFVSDLPGSGGRGSWDPSITFTARGHRDPWLVFSPLVAIRPRSARARVEALQALADANALSTALETMVSITDAHSAVLPSGEEIGDRFHPDVLLPEPSSPAQRQMALSMERHPLTVVLGPPGTGKTYTIANLLGHLLAQGKRVLVTAEKEEALHEVRGKVLNGLRSLVVPVLAGKAEDKTRLAQAISEISSARQHRRLSDRQQAVDRLTERQHELRGRRSELLNAITVAWENEHGDLVASGPYRGRVEHVADAVEHDRDRFEWLTDRPSDPTLPVADLSPVRRLTDPDVAAAAQREASVPHIAELPSANYITDLTGRRCRLDAELADLKGAADRSAAAAGPQGAVEAGQLADAMQEAARILGRLQATPRGSVDQLIEAARCEALAVWRGRLERARLAVDRFDTAANLLGDRQIQPAAEVSASTLRRAAAAIERHLSEGKRLGWFTLKAEVREAVRHLEGTTVDGSPVDTVDEARAIIAWAEAVQTASELQADWEGLEDVSLSGPMRGWSDRVRPLAEALANGLQLLDKTHECLAPVRDAGVALEDACSPESLYADARAVRVHSVSAQRDEAVEVINAEHDRVARGYAGHQFHGELVAGLKAARDDADPEPWRAALDRVAYELELRQQAQAAERILEQLATVVPGFVQRVRCGDEAAFAQLADLAAATAWAHAVTTLEHAASRAGLLERLTEVEAELATTRRELVMEGAWLRVHQRLEQEPRLSQALRDYAAAQKRVPKNKTAKSYLPSLRRAQRALERCVTAVPVWVMSVDRAAEMFVAGESDMFDVVIVDEASQCPITSALVMQYAPAVAIVGDPYQTSPPGFKLYENLEAARRRVSDVVVRDRLDPTSSLWTIAATVIDKITLTEHFRCPPEVIGWAQKDIYERREDLRLQVMTATKPRRPKPVISVHVADGYRDGDRNDAEAARLLDDLAELLDDLPPWVRDIGVIALKPGQASALQRAIFDRFDQRTLERLDVRVGTAYEFQGAQRDLVLVSMVDSPPDAGKTHQLRSQDSDTLNQLNVAVSRARQQLRLYHSVLPGAYKTEDVRRWLLEHVIAEDAAWEARQSPGVPAPVPESQRVAPFDSLSEQRLFNRLVGAGYAVRPQVLAPVGGANYRLDLVVDGEVGAVAIEYDGPHHDTPQQYLEDREREQDLVRCGWTVLRVHHTDFNRDRRAAVAALQQQLRDHGVAPVHEWAASAAAVDASREVDASESADEAAATLDVAADGASAGSTRQESGAPEPQSKDGLEQNAEQRVPREDGQDVGTTGSGKERAHEKDRAHEPDETLPGSSLPAVPSDESSSGEPWVGAEETEKDPAKSAIRAAPPPSRRGSANTLQLASQASALLAGGPLTVTELRTRLAVDGRVLDEVINLLQSLGFEREGDTITET
jgi:very-short-patch-repair endonuclease